MKLIIVRHGESEENSLGILQGLLPGKLSEIGIVQAEKLGKRLSEEKFDIIYCSPTSRCQETLQYISKFIDSTIPIVTSDLIRERDFGQFNGKSWKEINFDELDIDTPENRKMGVESLVDVDKRIKQFLEEIKSKHQNETVLIVSHSNPIRMMLANLLQKTFFEILKEIKISNASISIFEVGEKAIPVVINEIDFLK